MKIKILHEETVQPINEEGLDFLIRQILLDEYDEVVYDNSREHEFFWLDRKDELKNAFKNSKTKLILIKNGESTLLDLSFYEGNIKIVNSPFHLIRDTIHEFENIGYDLQNYKVNNFKTPILFLNGKPHWHRCMLMNNFHKTRWVKENTIYSWIWTQKEFRDEDIVPFDSWIEKSILLDEFKDGSVDQTRADIEQKPFFQLVSETTTNHFFLTEKTVKPLLLKQPFLVFGSVGFHKKLKDYGFKLYDEVFNYDFDFIEDADTRSKMILTEVNKLQNFDLQDLYKKLEPKLIHNLERCYELSYDKENNLELFDYISDRWESFEKVMNENLIHSSYAKKLFNE